MLSILREPKVDIGLTPYHVAQTVGWTSVFTPDIYRLTLYKYQRLFICDEWMGDRSQSFVLDDDVVHRVTAFTRDYYNFLIYENTALPVPDDNGHRIKGEMVIIRPMVFWNKLDKLKQNGIHFIRSRVEVIDPYRELTTIDNEYYDELGYELPEVLQGKKKEIGKEKVWIHGAWMYLPNPAYWEYMMKRRPELFDRVPRFPPKQAKRIERPWLDDYYKYQNPPED